MARDRMNNEVNAGSMADIAFLLLIFFLVTTTIAEDKGVLVLLPPYVAEQDLNNTADVNKRNLYSILVNKDDQLLVRGDLAELSTLRANIVEFITNPQKKKNYAESSDKAIVSIQNDRGTSYATYIGVYNEIKAAYNEIWDLESQKSYGKDYEALDKVQQKEVRKKYPLSISEAEPTEFGDDE